MVGNRQRLGEVARSERLIDAVDPRIVAHVGLMPSRRASVRLVDLRPEVSRRAICLSRPTPVQNSDLRACCIGHEDVSMRMDFADRHLR
jgi:hypothetical protein